MTAAATGARRDRHARPRRAAGAGPRLAVLDARHRAACAAHLLALDAADRGDRFWCVVGDDFVRRYAQGISGAGHVLVGALHRRRVVALAHAAPYPEGGAGAVEVGISVDAGMRRRGLGRRLLRAVLEAVGRRGGGSIHVLFRTTNRAMAALARSLGGRVGHDGAEAFAVFEPRRCAAAASDRRGCRRRGERAAGPVRQPGRARPAADAHAGGAARPRVVRAGGASFVVRAPAVWHGAARWLM